MGSQQGWARGDKLGERQSRAGQGQMEGVKVDFPTSNCFCYLIMSQTGKHPPPRLVSRGPPSLPAQGKFPGTKISLPDAASRLQSSNQDPADSDPWAIVCGRNGRWCRLRCWECGAGRCPAAKVLHQVSCNARPASPRALSALRALQKTMCFLSQHPVIPG